MNILTSRLTAHALSNILLLPMLLLLLLLLLSCQELNPKLGRARGLDLHSVAARLEQGLYQATGQSLQV
jgi:hypothetical protein